VKIRFLAVKSLAIGIALFPLRCPVTLDTGNLSGMRTHMWIWSEHRCFDYLGLPWATQVMKYLTEVLPPNGPVYLLPAPLGMMTG